MKFYEFNEYEYYALILAENEETAILGYEENVADIYEEEKDLSPNVVTFKHVLEVFKKSNIDGCNTEEEKVNELHSQIGEFMNGDKNVEKYLLLLIDGSLC